MLRLIFSALLLSSAWLTASVCCLAELGQAGGNVTTVHCVVPDLTPETNSTCHPLSYYVMYSSHYFTSNTVFVFHPGVFRLESVISVSCVDRLSLVGDSVAGSHLVQCSHSVSAGITITNSSNVVVRNLEFLRCSHLIDNTDYNYTSAALAFVSVTNLTVCAASVNESAGIGLFVYAMHGTCTITNSVFAYNSQFNDSFLAHYISGNTFITISNCPLDGTPIASLLINSSKFLCGLPSCYDCPSPGLYVRIETHDYCMVNVSITHSHFIGNRGKSMVKWGGNIEIEFVCYTGFKNTVINVSDNLIVDGKAEYGGGLCVRIFSRYYNIRDVFKLGVCSYNLTMDRNRFFGNTAGIEGGGLFLANTYRMMFDGATQGRISVRNCSFVGNRVTGNGYGAAAFISGYISFVHRKVSSFVLYLDNCYFKDNVTPEIGSGALYVLEVSDGAYISNCTFVNNRHTALSIVRSNVLLRGNVTLLGNTGYDGGAISFCSRSYIYFQNETVVRIEHNTALHSGGGIYAASQCPTTKPSCFFQFLVNIQTMIAYKSVRVVMTNNSASYAGSFIYGGYVDDCFVYGAKGTGYNSPDIFQKVFQVPSLTLQDLSPVSSPPSQVCFCNSAGLPNCTIPARHYIVFPGQTIEVSVVAVGEGKGVVPAIVVASPKYWHKQFINERQRLQNVGKRCKKLSYTLYRLGVRKRLEVHLDIEKTELYEIGRSPSPKNLSITFKRCPIGFTLRHKQRYCDCIDALKDLQCTCVFNGSTPLIQQKAGTWVGVINLTLAGDTFTALLTYSNCLFYYCTFNQHSNDLIINQSEIINSNSQCVQNRGGTLCGMCTKGHSVTNGVFACHDCTNTKLYTNIFIFLLFGVLLVFLLLFFNFTVSEGTINGLVFYANIVEYSILYFYSGPFDTFIERASKFLTNFVAVLNLSYGSGLCLYDGMDAFTKVWLDYTFPFYVLLLTVIIIYISRCSIRVSQLLGNNSPKLISTLLLLMYVKVIQTAIYGVSHADLPYESVDGTKNGTHTVWLYDGSIEFLRGKHVYLFAFSIVMIALSFPYALCLLLIQPLRWYSHLRPLQWVQRLMPLFDAYTGPFKRKYHFWPGLLLLARNVLLVVFAINSGGDPIISLSCVVLVCSLLQALAWSVGGVYRKRTLNALESFFFFNLTFISLAVAFGIYSDQRSRITTSVGLSVFASFLVTIVILLHHCYKQMRQRRSIACCRCCVRNLLQCASHCGLLIHFSQRAQHVQTLPELLITRQERDLRSSASDRDDLTEYSQLLTYSN